MEFIKICPLCGGNDIKDYYRGIDKYYSQKEVRLSYCGQCNLIFLNPRTTSDEYKNMYETVFQDKRRNLETYEQAVDRLIRKKRYAAKLSELHYFKNIINNNDKVLEIGGGWGSLAKAIKDKFGCNIKVIEPSALAAKVAKDYYKLDSFNGDFAEYVRHTEGKEKFNTIFSYHVFEHILNPNDFLQSVRSMLEADGKLLLALPNVRKPDVSAEFFYHFEHCYYYSPTTLSLMLIKNGFKVVKLWEGKKDMKVICALAPTKDEINYNNNEIEAIRLKQRRVDSWYKFLRNSKKILYGAFNERQKEKVNNFIYKYLRRY